MYLQIDSTEVPCRNAGRELDRTTPGGLRSTSGQWGIRTLARKRAWQFETTPLTLAEGEALRALLDGASRTASGDFRPDTATLYVRGEFGSADTVQLAAGLHVVISFILREA